jgi:hypothetical protein
MPLVFALVLIFLCLPLLFRLFWFLLKAHVVLIAIFLPAGLLLTSGRIHDVETYLVVSCVSGLVMLALLTRRHSRSSA